MPRSKAETGFRGLNLVSGSGCRVAGTESGMLEADLHSKPQSI